MTAPKMSFPTDNGRYYGHPTQQASVPSITNIKKQENQPAINASNLRKMAEYAVENRERLAALTPAEQVQIIKGSQYAKNPASRIGDIVHAWVDGFIKTGKHPKDDEPLTLYEGTASEEVVTYDAAPITARRMYRQFEGWRDKHKPTFTASEFTVWSYKYGYAGTADFSAVISNWLVLVDTKTGAGVYPDVAKQLAPLCFADVMITVQGDETELPKYDRAAVLHLRPTYSEFPMIDSEALESAFKAFLGLKANFDHNVSFADRVLVRAPRIQADYKGV